MKYGSLREIIGILVEDLGNLGRGSTPGWGTNQPIKVKPVKQSLGDTAEHDEGVEIDQAPVKVSKAFLVAQSIDEPAEA